MVDSGYFQLILGRIFWLESEFEVKRSRFGSPWAKIQEKLIELCLYNPFVLFVFLFLFLFTWFIGLKTIRHPDPERNVVSSYHVTAMR